MFGHRFEAAIQTMRSCKITRLSDEFGRTIYEVVSPNDTYYVYSSTFFCSCPSFKRQVLVMQEIRLCKHVIATRIASALKGYTVEEEFMDADAMTEVFCDMSHFSSGYESSDPVTKKTSGKRGSNKKGDGDTSGEGDTSADSLAPEAGEDMDTSAAAPTTGPPTGTAV